MKEVESVKVKLWNKFRALNFGWCKTCLSVLVCKHLWYTGVIEFSVECDCLRHVWVLTSTCRLEAYVSKYLNLICSVKLLFEKWTWNYLSFSVCLYSGLCISVSLTHLTVPVHCSNAQLQMMKAEFFSPTCHSQKKKMKEIRSVFQSKICSLLLKDMICSHLLHIICL